MQVWRPSFIRKPNHIHGTSVYQKSWWIALKFLEESISCLTNCLVGLYVRYLNWVRILRSRFKNCDACSSRHRGWLKPASRAVYRHGCIILLVHYCRELNSQGLEELWIKTGTGDSSRLCSNPYPCSSVGTGALSGVASSALNKSLWLMQQVWYKTCFPKIQS